LSGEDKGFKAETLEVYDLAFEISVNAKIAGNAI
jgi:hypothetical protein